MPQRVIRFELDTTDGRNVEDYFKRLYGGSEGSWRWLRRMLERTDPAELRRRCERLEACDVLRLAPFWLFGRLAIKDEAAWWRGLHEGVFHVEAVMHDDYATRYYEARLAELPSTEQDL